MAKMKIFKIIEVQEDNIEVQEDNIEVQEESVYLLSLSLRALIVIFVIQLSLIYIFDKINEI